MSDRLLPIVPSREESPPPFDRVAIVGLGLIGGSVALACRTRWPSALLIAVDRKDVLEPAMVHGAVDVGADDLGIVGEADLVVLAAPVGEILRLIPQLPDVIRGDAVITDTGSVKRAIVRAAACLPERLPFVGGHPMGGGASSGLAGARADLFADKSWIFTPAEGTGADAVERLSQWASALGARPVTMSADEHDRLLAAISHLPQVLASALMAVTGERAGETGLALAGDGLRDTTRLASSPASMWADILASNADEIGPAIDAVIEELHTIRERLGDAAAVEALFARAATWRARLSG